MGLFNMFTRVAVTGCMAAALAFAGAPGGAQTDDGATAPTPEAATLSGGPINWYRAAAREGSVSTTSTDFVAVPDMSVTVRAQRRSNLLITFTAECSARPDTPGDNAIVVIEARVDGVTVPGHQDLLFCSNKQFYVETHSYQWVYPVRAKRVRTVEIFYRTGRSTPSSSALLGDMVLTVQFQRM